MPLSNIIDRAVELNTIMGVTDQPKAARAAIDLLASDPGATREAIHLAVVKCIHDQTTRTMRRLGGDGRQKSLFGLHERYALDLDRRVIKDTDRLTRTEFKAILKLREKQVADDTEHLNALRRADRQLDPIWEEYPDKTFREIEIIYFSREMVPA
jgi:hypothetical protein